MAESAVFLWEGTDKQGKKTNGEITSASSSIARAELRRQGIVANKVKKKSAKFALSAGGKPKPADIALFTRQMATMMRAGVPLVQAFDIVADGLDKPKVSDLIRAVRNDVSGGSSFAATCSATWWMPASSPDHWKPCWTGSPPTRRSPNP
jgi:type IV pilus assembly protein PilC